MHTAYTVASQSTLGTCLPTSLVYVSPYSGTMASICGHRSGHETNSQGNSDERRPRSSPTTHKFFKQVALGEERAFAAACFRNLLHGKH